MTDAWLEFNGETVPKFQVALQNSAPADVTAYEVRWTLYNSQGEQVSFSSATDSALPAPLIRAGEQFTPPGGSYMYFKGFEMERASAEITYYQLVDGRIYDSKKTSYGANLQSRRAEWSTFYRQVESAMANRAPLDAEAEIKRQVEAEFSRKSEYAAAAQALQNSLNSQGVAKTTALMKKAIAMAQK